MATDRIPSRIGRYEPKQEVGRGTMGVVYAAWDPDLGRTIALKVVAPAFAAPGAEREAFERRFLAEARAAARLSHPGIVVVHDVGRDPATRHLYMALELLDGVTLQDRLAAGPLPWPEALRIVGRVATALHHAHANGVVHRDVKPANIMILASGQTKILDFGIARVDAGHLTLPGEMFGTPLYMAPEQALGRAADARSDLFSLGAVAYAALCGRPAFAGGNVAAIVAAITQHDAPAPSALAPDVPEPVDYLVGRAMARAPEGRYADVRAFAEDVADVLDGKEPRHRAGWVPPPSAPATLVSAADLPELELVEEAAPRVRRRTGRTLILFAVLLGVALAYFRLHGADAAFWRRELPRLAAAARAYTGSVSVVPPTATAPAFPQPVSAPAATAPAPYGAAPPPSDAPPTTAPSEAAPATEPPATPPPTEPAAVATPEALPSPSPAPASPAPAHRAPPKAAPTPPARATAPVAGSQLVLEIEFQADAGALELWVDDARLLQVALRSRTRRPAVGVAPGRHRIEVRLKAGAATRSARTSAVFKPGATRRLGVAVLRGRAPTLEWR